MIKEPAGNRVELELNCACEENGMGRDCKRRLIWDGYRISIYNGDDMLGNFEFSSENQIKLANALLGKG